MSGGERVILEAHCSPDGEEFVTRQHAAKLMGVSPSTIDTWERKGYLKRLPGSGRKPLYPKNAVAEAESLARQAALRTSGTDRRVRRAFEVS